MPALLWLRRDLRVADNPALLAAREAADGELAVCFVIDPALWRGGGPVRRAWVAASVRALDERLGGRLVLRVGDPGEVVPALADELGAGSVHAARETTPGGAARDGRVREALAARQVAWVETGTPYAVGPGTIRNGQGDPYRVFTPFLRAWQAHGSADPAPTPRRLGPVQLGSDPEAGRALRDAPSCATVSPPTTRPGTDRTWTAPAGCRHTSRSGRSTRAACWPTSPDGAGRGRRGSSPSWPGGSSTPTSCTTTRAAPGATCGTRSSGCGTTTPRTRSRRGGGGGPATRSSTRGCGSCWPRGGCPTGCG